MNARVASPRITADQIREAMTRKWPAPEWAIFFEVSNGTGVRAGRYADAVMASLWPSRGLELHGVEIKVSRSDWRREAKDPAKAETIARYLDRWWVHAPPDVVPLEELPPAWGLRTWDGRQWKTVCDACKTPRDPMTPWALAALLRRADEANRAVARHALAEERAKMLAEVEKQRDAIRAQVEKEVARRTARLDGAAKRLAEFEEAFGTPLGEWDNVKGLGRAARALVSLGDRWQGITPHRLRELADELDALKAMVGSDET